ncbi:MAG TPA: hypothetical protein V6D14_15110 [Coleofasciculaceae cyanobacterium]|jgi:hypothetical protein
MVSRKKPYAELSASSQSEMHNLSLESTISVRDCHEKSSVGEYVTMSLGAASIVPKESVTINSNCRS